MIRLFIIILFLLNSCSKNDINNLSKSTEFSYFYKLSIDEYKQKLENYNKLYNYPNIDKWKKYIM